MEKFNKLGLSRGMSYQELKSTLRKQKQTWTTRESSGIDRVRREAEEMTEFIAQLRELLEQIPEDSKYAYAALATLGFFLEDGTASPEDAAGAVLDAVRGDEEGVNIMAGGLLALGQDDLAAEWVSRELVEAAKAQMAESQKKETQPEPPKGGSSSGSGSSKGSGSGGGGSTKGSSSGSSKGSSSGGSKGSSSGSSKGSGGSSSGSSGGKKKRKSHKGVVVLVLLLLAAAALAWFGPERGHPIQNARSILETLLHRESEDSGERIQEQELSATGTVLAAELPEPLCVWDFTQGLAEVNGMQTTPGGDCQVVDVLGDGQLMAASFDGDGDYLELGRAYNMSERFTMNVVLNCLEPYKRYAAFFAKYETNGAGPYAYSIHDGRVNCWISTENGSVSADSDAAIDPGVWYLITIVRDGDQVRLYVNGQPDVTLELDAAVLENEDLVTIGRQALLFDPATELQFTGYMRRIDLYLEAMTAEQILQYWQDLDLGQLPTLAGRRVREAAPLWGALEDGGYEVLEYVPEGAMVVYLEDVNEQYVRVSYHGRQGNMDVGYLYDES